MMIAKLYREKTLENEKKKRMFYLSNIIYMSNNLSTSLEYAVNTAFS